MERIKPKVLLVGDFDHHEFRDSVVWLRANTELTVAATVTDVLQSTGDVETEDPHTVILAQSRLGQFTNSVMERVARAFPLSHLMTLLGSLCEGEARKSTPWPGVVRVYWHQFLARCPTQLQIAPRITAWQLPRTASDVERALVAIEQLETRSGGLVAVFTRDALLFDALSTACRKLGRASVWCSTPERRTWQGATVGIWDGVTQGVIDFVALERLHARQLDLPLIALLAFPRLDQVQRAATAGAQRVLTCPFLLPDLENTLREVTGPPRRGLGIKPGASIVA